MKRLMIFIDGNNLFGGCKETGISIDYRALIDLLTKGYDLIRVYFYIGMPHKGVWDKNYESWQEFSGKLDKQIRFLESLEFKYNFHVVKRPLALIDGKRKEKGIDVHLACDVIWHGLSNNYDDVIIISGDKDLLEAIERMKDCGKRVIIANFEKVVSRDVIKLSDSFINLSNHIEQIKYKSTSC